MSIRCEYISHISYIKGCQNTTAACMSRLAFAIQVDVCDLREIIETLEESSVSGMNSKILFDVSILYLQEFFLSRFFFYIKHPKV